MGVGHSDVDIEPEVEVARSGAASNPPIHEREVADNDRDVVSRDAERLEAFNDLSTRARLASIDRPTKASMLTWV